MRIGVLALQGAFIEHINMIKKISNDIDVFEIRNILDVKEEFDGLILPGGESTTQGNLLKSTGLFSILKEKIEKGLPTFGTCAGMILLAKKLNNDDRVHFGVLDIEVKRNAFGRQLGSFTTENEFLGLGKVDMVFIRGPIVEKVFNNIEILSKVNGEIVAVRENNILATAYHPELTNDTKVHEYFLNIIKIWKKKP